MKKIVVSMLSMVFIGVFSQENTNQKESLQDVVVTTHKNTYKIDSTLSVAKIPLKELENPQVYNSISKMVLKDQVSTSFSQAIQNATGVSRLWESTGRGGDGAEFYTLRGFSVQPNVVNGVASISNGTIDPANTESIEIIKGPSGTVFGGNIISYGGLMNVVTKKPYQRFGGELSYITGSFGLNRVTADVNTVLNNESALRINAAYHSQNSFQDAGFSKSFFVAPSFSYKASNQLTFLVNTEFKQSESANAPMIFLSRYSPLSFSTIDIFEKNYEKSYTSDALTIKNPSFGLQAQALYTFHKNWTSQTIVASSSTKSNGYYHYLWDSSNGSDFTRFISKRNGETVSYNIQQNFLGDFSIGTFRNRIVIGFDYMNKDIKNSSTGWISNGTVSLQNQTDTGILTSQGVDALLVGSSESVSSVTTNILSAYISNVINFTPALSAMMSLRVDHFKGTPEYWSGEELKNQVSLSPKFGLVYQPILDKLSLFANYMNGFVNLTPTEVSDINGQNPQLKTFDPEQANQWEIGAKANIISDKISLVASYYDIEVSNKVMTDPNNPNNQIQGGEVESKGFELSLVTSPIEGLSIIAGFSSNHSEVVKDTENGGYIGLRPEEAGPETLINFWAKYQATSGWLRNFGFGLGSNYASEHKTLNRENIGTFSLPNYTVWNAVLSYSQAKFGVNLKFNNLFDEKYYTGWSTVSPQASRSISCNVYFKF